MAQSRSFLDKLKYFNHAFDEFNCLMRANLCPDDLTKDGRWPYSQACEDLALKVYKFRLDEEVITASEGRLKDKLVA